MRTANVFRANCSHRWTCGPQTLELMLVYLLYLVCPSIRALSQSGGPEMVTIHPDLPRYRLHFVENAATKTCGTDQALDCSTPAVTITPEGTAANKPTCRNPCGQSWLLGWLKVYAGNPERFLQTIPVRVRNGMMGQYGLQDVNFDGYQDISFAVDRGAKFVAIEYWLFDPVSRRFTQTALARQLGEIWPNNIELDGRAREIRTDHFWGACDPLSRHTYRIAHEHLFLLAADDFIPGVDRNCAMVHVATPSPLLDPSAHIEFERWVALQSAFPAESWWTAEPVSPKLFRYITTPGTPHVPEVRVIRIGAKWKVQPLPPSVPAGHHGR